MSVWVGNFSNESDFDDCTDETIADQLGLKTDLASICEVDFRKSAAPVGQLLEGFSGWKSFIDAAEASAKSLNVTAANAALVCYNLKCENAPTTWGTMHFLGSFAGRDISA